MYWIRIRGFFKITLWTKEFWKEVADWLLTLLDLLGGKLIALAPIVVSGIVLGLYARALYETYIADFFKGGVLLVMGVIAFASLRVYNAILANTTSNYRLLNSLSKFITQLGAISTSMSNLSKRTKPRGDGKG